ncbi:MAG: hypothetical protein E6G04_07290 [Actinobacteria bacterium]|nr:MAG: hypothetical protein E6G04_07290 [Actinomycetota bacterium]
MQTRAVVFRSDDLTLEGQIIIPEQPRAALLLCHGIPGGGPPDPTDEGYEGFARAMAASRFAAMWFNFRGCRGARRYRRRGRSRRRSNDRNARGAGHVGGGR